MTRLTHTDRKKCHHFAYDIFKFIFLNEIIYIGCVIQISLKYVADPINSIQALVDITALQRTLRWQASMMA